MKIGTGRRRRTAVFGSHRSCVIWKRVERKERRRRVRHLPVSPRASTSSRSARAGGSKLHRGAHHRASSARATFAWTYVASMNKWSAFTCDSWRQYGREASQSVTGAPALRCYPPRWWPLWCGGGHRQPHGLRPPVSPGVGAISNGDVLLTRAFHVLDSHESPSETSPSRGGPHGPHRLQPFKPHQPCHGATSLACRWYGHPEPPVWREVIVKYTVTRMPDAGIGRRRTNVECQQSATVSLLRRQWM